MKKIIVFGTGLYWKNRKDVIIENCEIVCFMDNNSDKWDHMLDGHMIVNPVCISEYEYDIVLIMSKSEAEIKAQLSQLGVPARKVYNWKDYCIEENIIKYYGTDGDIGKKDIIIISTDAAYNGGTMAAIYAMKALKQRGKKVLLCVPNCDGTLCKELLAEGEEILVVPALLYCTEKRLHSLIMESEMVIVNVFQMLPVACEISCEKPVFWWIHEPMSLYEPILQLFPEYNNVKRFENINIKAVSRIPEHNFNTFFPDRITDTLPYGIPDEYLPGELCNDVMPEKIVFAIIGCITERKAQDIYISAVKLLTEEEKNLSQFLMIGESDASLYADQVLTEAESLSCVNITGLLTREQMRKIYQKIDVVVCPSREDPLPIVMTEAMMHKKACIASDRTGTAEYITNGVNGFVCKTEDVEDLCDKIRYFIHNRKETIAMGNNARKIYDKYFTLNAFGERLERIVEETIKQRE